MTDRDPFDDIAHLDFDPEDEELARSLQKLDAPPPTPPPAGDPRTWSPSEDDDPEDWVLSDEDKALKQRLAWESWRRGRRARWAGAVLAIAILAVSISALLNRIVSDDPPKVDRTAERDNGPTSAEMASYLPDEAAVRDVDPSLTLVPGNTGGSYDNLSFDELDAGGPEAATFGAEAGVVQRWTAADGRSLTVAIYFLDDRDAAAAAEAKALDAARDEEGATSAERHRFTVVTVATADGTDQTATRVLSRFLVTFDALGGFDEVTASDLLEVVADASAAVH